MERLKPLSTRVPSKYARQNAQQQKPSIRRTFNDARDSNEHDTPLGVTEKNLLKFPYECNQCMAYFRSFFYWRKHSCFHILGKQRCKVNSSTDNLGQHLLIDNGDMSIVCSYCHKSFESVSKLNNHLLVHVGDNVHACGLCGMTFPSSISLARHASHIHPAEGLNSAKSSGERSVSSSNLRRRKTMKKHICSKHFLYPSNLKCHIRVHTGEQPYTCSYCNVKYKYVDRMKEHDHHTGEKPYACHLCSACFA